MVLRKVWWFLFCFVGCRHRCLYGTGFVQGVEDLEIRGKKKVSASITSGECSRSASCNHYFVNDKLEEISFGHISTQKYFPPLKAKMIPMNFRQMWTILWIG